MAIPASAEWQDHFADQYWEMNAKRTSRAGARRIFGCFSSPADRFWNCVAAWLLQALFSTKANILAIDFDHRTKPPAFQCGTGCGISLP
jgi:hypothetical protein